MDFASRRSRRLLATVVVLGAAGMATCAKHPDPGAPAGADLLATIDGRVLSAAGQPIGAVTVLLDEDRGPEPIGLGRTPIATVRSAADGRFHIANLPAGRYRLRAHAAEHADGHLRLEVHARERLATSVRLGQAETLNGQVVDRKGQPIPGARVLAWSLADPPAMPREAATDDAGRFVLRGLTRGLHRLIAEAPGFGSVEQGPLEVPGAVPVLRMETDGHNVTGTVIAGGGGPAMGARVVIGGENLSPTRETTTRADGSFLFSGLGAGVYVLRASRLGEVSRVSDEVVVDRSGERPPEVRLVLGPGWMVVGRVIDDAGRSLPGAEVRVDALPGEDQLPEVVHPDAKGDWRAGPLQAGEYRLTPRQPGFVARRPVQVMLGSSTVGGDRPQLLELVRGAEIVGRVIDQKGAPVREAIVRCLVPGREDLSVIADRLPLAAEAAGLPSGSGHALGRTRSVATDLSGRFQLADMLPGKVSVQVNRTGSVPRRSGELSLQPGQRLDVGDMVLQDGVRLAGRVVDDADAPIDGARVVIAGAAVPRGGAAPPEIVLLTDRGGQFVTSVLAGPQRLRISAAGMQDHDVTVSVAAAPPPVDVTVRLTRADARLEGAVRDGVGRPIARARVVAWPAPAASSGGGLSHVSDGNGGGNNNNNNDDGGDGTGSADGVAPLASAVTDPGGHFSLSRLPRGMILLEVKHADYPRTAETVDVAKTPRASLVISVPIPGGVQGEVREKVTGAVVSTYRIEARGPDGRVATATQKRGASAGFMLSRLLPGRWTLGVRAPGYIATEVAVEVPANSTLGESSVRDLRVEIAAEPRP